MKAKKKPQGIKHKIRRDEKRETRIGLAFFATILIVATCVSGFFIISKLYQLSTGQATKSEAAIVDHLSLTAPNQTFREAVTNTLEQAGYKVDYFQGEQITVEFYRNLPTHGYKIIILRVHSALAFREGGKELGYVDLFSSEPYSTNKYVYEQLTDQVSKVMFLTGGSAYFGISPPFIEKSMNGRFSNTLIIMMGCNGLTHTSLAKAFVDRGAKAYISWDKSVTATHTDTATANLLQHLLIENQTLREAVEKTMQEVGPDPTNNSQLKYYPLEAGGITIQNITTTQNITGHINVEIRL